MQPLPAQIALPAANPALAGDPVAHLESGYRIPGLYDFPSPFMSWNDRQSCPALTVNP
jgi:hypothetical protein